MNYRRGATGGTTLAKPPMDVTSSLAPLIREPVIGPVVSMNSQRGLPACGPSSHLTLTQSVSNHGNEDKRREKLRAVLALMGSSSGNKATNRRRKLLQQTSLDSDEKLDDIAETSSGLLGESSSDQPRDISRRPLPRLTIANLNPNRSKRHKARRKVSVSSDSTQSSLRGRRGAILAGKLLVRSFPEEAVVEKPEPEIDQATKEIKVGKFRVISKLIVLLVRFGRTYILTENDAQMIRLFSALDAAQAGDRYKIKSDLIFDVTQFRANKQFHISQDTKRILAKPPEKRTETEITHVQVELQPLKFVKRYPVAMQRSMIQAAAYEEFTQARVITRYGKQPQAFYLILGGSALVLEGDPDFSGRDTTAIDKGDVFGHQAIGNQSTHKCSVISKERIHLLSLSVEDYSRIFLAGGLQNFSDVDDGRFIRSLFLFDGWPIHLLKDNPKMVKFNYYTQGTVIVEDSDRLEWIYIVKSGSCSVMKRLHPEAPNSPIPVKRRRKGFATRAINHEQKLSQKLQELQRKRTKKMKGSYRPDAWKPNLLRVPVVKDPLDGSVEELEISPSTTKINVVSCSSSYDVDNRQLRFKNDVDVVVTSSVGHDVKLVNNSVQDQQKGKLLPHERIKFAKGPYLTHPKPVADTSKNIKEQRSNSANEQIDQQEAPSKKGTTTMPEQSNGDSKQSSSSTTPRHRKKPLHVQIDVLEKGDVFGLMDIAFGKQLSHMSLVSNGVECIQLSKRFYMKHINESIIKTITDKMRPYATEETLTKDLQEKLTWKDHRETTMKDTARKFKRHKKLLADPRLPRPALLPDL